MVEYGVGIVTATGAPELPDGVQRIEQKVRVELTLPSGAAWEFGPEDAADTVRGEASEYCRVFVQRVAVADTKLTIEGDAAHRAMAVARAYL